MTAIHRPVTGAPKSLNRPCTITKSPSATIVPASYFNVGGMLFDEMEQTLTTWCDMSAVLNVVRRPVWCRGCIVTLVEKHVERFQDEGLVLFGRSLRHVDSFLSLGVFDRTHEGRFMLFELDEGDLPSHTQKCF